MKFSGKMCFRVILRFRKTRVPPSLQKINFSKTQGAGQFDPPGRLGLIVPTYKILIVHENAKVDRFSRMTNKNIF